MSLSTLLLDLLFPIQCAGCNTPGPAFCTDCRATFPPRDPACLVCDARNHTGAVCNSCRTRIPYLTRVLWAVSYDIESVRRAIAQFKYHGNRALAEPLADCIVAFLKKQTQGNSLVVPARAFLLPIPLHARKQRERGFNQAEILAGALADKLQLPLLPSSVLVRARYTLAQAQVRGLEKRRQNIDRAFNVPSADASLIHDKTIVLIDDIATTGSTLNDAARALKIAGAKHVWGLVIAKG